MFDQKFSISQFALTILPKCINTFCRMDMYVWPEILCPHRGFAKITNVIYKYQNQPSFLLIQEINISVDILGDKTY